jgi:hypothetical protein
MKTKVFITLLTLTFIGSPLAAPILADLIVDTKSPSTTKFIEDGGTQQGFASEFTIANPMTITSISSWLSTASTGSETLEAAIHTDGGGGIPGIVYTTNGTTYSTTFKCEILEPDWCGPTGLNWFLPSGSYWAVININHTGFEGYIGISPPDPLPNNAYYENASYCEWAPGGHSYAWQINANAVPLPPSLLLLGSGLLGMGALGWRRRRS